MRWRGWKGPGWPDGDVMVLGRRRPERKGIGRRRRFRCPRADSWLGEEEDGEASLMVASVGFGTAGVDGVHDSGGDEQKLEDT